MKADKTRRILAIVALVFMAIFTVTFIIVLVSPDFLNGAVGYIALISALLGVGFFMVVKFVLKEKEPPAYIPEDDCKKNSDDDMPDAEDDSAKASAIQDVSPSENDKDLN